MEHHFVVGITEINVIHNEVALERLVLDLACRLMNVLPRPKTCASLALGKLAVLINGVDKGNVAVVGLARLVEEFKNSLRACKCHYNAVNLLAELVNRL